MEDFFNQFKRNLENRPEPVYENRLWSRLNKDLDEGEKKPKGGVFWWWAIPGMLLLASNIFLFTKLNNTNQQSIIVEIQRDTIYKTNVIYQTDTIYKTVVKRERIVEQAPTVYYASKRFNFSSPYFNEDYERSQNQKTVANLWNDYSGNTKPGFFSQNIGLSSGKNKDAENDLAVSSGLVDPLPKLDLGFLEHASPTLPFVEMEEREFKKSMRYYIQKFQPKGFRIGANAGWVMPINEGLYNHSGRQYGIQSYLDFSPSLRMWFDLSYLNIYFETDRMDENIGVPVIAIPDDLVFEKAEVPQPSLQYAVGMEYYFNSRKKLKPFIGLGYAAVSLFPYEVGYEFENVITGLEWDFEEKVNNRTLVSNFLLLELGLEYEFKSNWAMQLKSSYRSNLDHTGFQSPRLFNVQAGLNYRFGSGVRSEE